MPKPDETASSCAMATQFKAARRVGTPIVAIGTADPAATIQFLMQKEGALVPCYAWDCIDGLQPLNQEARRLLAKCAISSNEIAASLTPVSALDTAKKLPSVDDTDERAGAGAVLFAMNLGLFFKEPEVVQAIWNIRDLYKSSMRTLVMLGPSFKLPIEIAGDVMLLEEELPDEAALGAIIDQICEDAGMSDEAALSSEARQGAVFAMRGLPAFAAEQAAAMSIVISDGRAAGIDAETLWERKRGMIGQTPGLKINMGGESFDTLGGLDSIKRFTARLFAGRSKPTVIVRVDEIEKSLAGAAGDLSGTSQDALGVLLREMEDNSWKGFLAIGYPGTGKSALSKAMGNLGGVPTIEIDLGAMKGSLVGESEAMVRAAMKVIKAVAGDGALFVGTCNRITDDMGRTLLPPELLRRFAYGKWFFDLPSEADRDRIWSLYRSRFELGGLETPNGVDDAGWTGAEIKTCCEIAWRLDCPLSEAAKYIVPFAASNAGLVQQLRESAHEKYLSATEEGVYIMPAAPSPAKAPGNRRFGGLNERN